MLGRRTKRVHPSAGQTTWQYDQASNMTKQTMSSGEYVDYNYNYNQLSNVKYSHRYWNDVWYEYGGANNGNQTGRLVKQQDATGVQEFEYGNMGELIMNSHSYVVPNSSQAFSLTTRWEYDSWNRVKQIIYPDNEKVTYNYNLGGLLKHVEGDKNGNTTVYIDKIEYDDYEQRTAVYNGNNTSTLYDYDPVMRRMTTLTTVNPNGSLLKNEYAYDGVGNIISIDNVGMNPYHQEYNYDDTYQLMSARGNWSDINNNMADYRLNMSYSPSGKITNKTLLGDKIDQSGTYTLDHSTDYSYSNINPYAVRNTYDSHNGLSNDFDWDAKGNMILHHSEQWGDRQFCWTEDNRLQAVKDDKMGAYYNYDASGERNLKLSGGNMNVTQNGYTMNVPVLDEQTLYASALVTINDKGYTKHYFEEGKRICSKIGSGGLHHTLSLSTPIEGDYQDIHDHRSIGGVIKTFDMCMGLEPRIKNEDIYQKVIKPYAGQINPDEPVFYYHSDHLGSASYITDDVGDPTQHLVYLPFGEDWVDMKYNTSQFDTPYKFNGKEKDPETGLHYYGARYLNTDLSIWLSVDPMSDKYPHLTSYNYCANNPVMLVDPDGRDVEPTTPEAAEQIKKYTSEQINGKKNKDYQPEFAALYKDWEENELINVKFTTVTEEGIGGTVDYTYQPDKKAKDEYTISWNPNITDKLGTSALFEEAAHLDDGLKGGYGIKNGNKGFGINNEIKAKDWTINNIKNITPTYMEGGLLKQTHYGYFKKNPSKLNGNSLGNGVSLHATPGMKSYILYGTGGKGYKTMLENEKMKK